MIKALALDVDGTITDKNRRGCISAIDIFIKVEEVGNSCSNCNWEIYYVLQRHYQYF